MDIRLPLRVAVLGAVAVALCALAGWPQSSRALDGQFQLNNGDMYARGSHVIADDGGSTPFFRPGVVVWDGGSIVGGHGADSGYELAAQTLAVLPKTCVSYVSSTASAKIADMLADAPVEVDAHLRRTADLNVCVVQAGGGDFRIGASATSVYQSVKAYCDERRAAGFAVVVVTLLPSHRPLTFEAARLAYNTMLRSGWPKFADALADVASDPRIGDTGDELDGQFYRDDALHLTNAGNAVMAAVTAPVLAELPWVSSRCEIRVRDAAGAWSGWRPWNARSNLWLEDFQGEHVVEAEYRLDGGTPVAVADTIFLDTERPEPRALRDSVARRGKKVALRYQVDDLEPCGPVSTVTIQVKTASGYTLKTWVRRAVPVNEPQAQVFTCRLPRGTYRWSVRARDTAGNADTGPGQGLLRVR